MTKEKVHHAAYGVTLLSSGYWSIHPFQSLTVYLNLALLILNLLISKASLHHFSLVLIPFLISSINWQTTHTMRFHPEYADHQTWSSSQSSNRRFKPEGIGETDYMVVR